MYITRQIAYIIIPNKQPVIQEKSPLGISNRQEYWNIRYCQQASQERKIAGVHAFNQLEPRITAISSR